MTGIVDVLVVGSGGREHAIAWAVARSPRCGRLVVAPGNGGCPGEQVAIAADDVEGLTRFATEQHIGLVIVGPEVALAAGLVDMLDVAGIPAFGPTRAAAELEWSKAFSRAFCERHGIVGPRAAVVTSVAHATAWIDALGAPVVVKADGLAAGKGVVLPDGRDATVAAVVDVLASASSAAGGCVVLEERLVGEEVSLLAFTDGHTVVAMPPAQDHKRLADGDRGPNTGGMGAYAPAPCCPPELVVELARTVLQPTVEAMAAEGRPYRGVLYAGIMLTADGPRVLEFNCRFGDPEAQVLLPLLDGDLVEIALACVHGNLRDVAVQWSKQSALTIVAASPGYPAAPTTGALIDGLDAMLSPALVFHAGTAVGAAGVVTAGGRVLAVTGVADDLNDARALAYEAMDGIGFEGKQVRRDIGWRAIARHAADGGYRAAGVDIDAGNDAVNRLRVAVERTHTPAVLAGIGSFGGVFDLAGVLRYRHPVLVASTDGVGTKVMLAAEAGRPAVSGIDIVNHCIDDVLVQNARPLFFLDYIASSNLDPALVAAVVGGMADACAAAGCALLGGETAEMPGVYTDGHFDVAGTLIGVAERDGLLPRTGGDGQRGVAPGDVLIGLASSGPHTNGYSLLRRVFAAMPLDASPEPLPGTLADALLAPHRSYLGVLAPVLDQTGSPIKALMHITGGGLIENPPRVLPPGCGVEIRLGSWPVPPLFRLVRDVTGLGPHELHRTLNMGIGMVLVVASGDVAAMQAALEEESWVIGAVTHGDGTVALV